MLGPGEPIADELQRARASVHAAAYSAGRSTQIERGGYSLGERLLLRVEQHTDLLPERSRRDGRDVVATDDTWSGKSAGYPRGNTRTIGRMIAALDGLLGQHPDEAPASLRHWL